VTLRSGAASARGIRPSQLLFSWTARYGQLDAITGQAGLFTMFIGVGYAPGTVEGQNGSPITAGHGMLRFDQGAARGTITRLKMAGEPVGQDSENLIYPFPLKITETTLFWRVFPDYTVGQNIAPAAYGVMIGSATTGAGWMGVRRLGTDWQAVRKRGAVEIASTLTDIGRAFPVDVLVTLGTGGVLQLSLRDVVTGVITVGATATDSTMLTAGETWGGSQLQFTGIQGLVAPGGWWYHETVKVARGVKTFGQIDAMS
jgi:hypothetical protein